MASSASLPTGARDEATEPPAAGGPERPAAPSLPPHGRQGTRRFGDGVLALVTGAVTLPILWMGYGTDLDIEAVLATAGRIRDLDYLPSRNPGVPVVETIVALLDPVGGHVLVNLATAGALAATVVGIARLVQAWGHDNGDLVALAFLASPIVIIAGTQTADFVWATAFFVWGALALVRDRPLAAGVLLALTIGSRSSSLLLIVALLAAVAWDPAGRRRCLRAAAVLVPVALLLYVPAWLSFDRTFGFLTATDGWYGLANNLGRFVVKNYAVGGVALAAVVAVALPALVRSLGRWNDDPMLRFAVLGLVATEALFLRVPWKPTHLVPCLMTLLLWVAASDRNRRRFLWVVVGAMAINGLVVFRPFIADVPNSTKGADFEPAVTVGWLLNELDCRAEYMHEPPRLASGAWACTLEPMRGTSDGATGTLE
ncbi:MAG TPA: hypothetical protein VFH36_10140 [Acidimicrobiales bacterium]|nr:hypothetical protein [Acidimicrobiales bacterium]